MCNSKQIQQLIFTQTDQTRINYVINCIADSLPAHPPKVSYGTSNTITVKIVRRRQATANLQSNCIKLLRNVIHLCISITHIKHFTRFPLKNNF